MVLATETNLTLLAFESEELVQLINSSVLPSWYEHRGGACPIRLKIEDVAFELKELVQLVNSSALPSWYGQRGGADLVRRSNKDDGASFLTRGAHGFRKPSFVRIALVVG
jgi:hypothetical protein